MEKVKIGSRYDDDNHPRQRSGFECFIIMLFVAILGYYLIFSEVPVLP